MSAENHWLPLVDRYRKVRLRSYTRLACGHESSPTNTVWIGKGRCKCKRCEDIMKILAAFDSLDLAEAQQRLIA